MTYRPVFRPQLGDPTTAFDSVICTYAAGAMLLDFETRGSVRLWGGELFKRSGDTDPLNGGNLNPDLKRAWDFYGHDLDVRTFADDGTFDGAKRWLGLGYAVEFGGAYREIPLSERCQDNADIGHALIVLPERRVVSGVVEWLTGDPLCAGYNWMREIYLRRYAEVFGRKSLPVVGGEQRVFYAKTNRAELPDTSTGDDDMALSFDIVEWIAGTVTVVDPGASAIQLDDGKLVGLPVGHQKKTGARIRLQKPYDTAPGDRRNGYLIGTEAALLLKDNVEFVPDPTTGGDVKHSVELQVDGVVKATVTV